MATAIKTPMNYKDFVTTRMSMPDALPAHFIPGIVTDSFTLSVETPTIKGKGNIFAWQPMAWDSAMNIADFDNKDDSSLYINTNYIKGKAIKLTLKLQPTCYPPKAGNGKLKIEFDYNTSNKQSKTIALPFVSSSLANYTAQSKILIADSTMIKISSKEFEHWAFREVKIEIFEPYFLDI